MSSNNIWICPICQPKVQCTSDADQQRHELGKKHIKQMEKHNQNRVAVTHSAASSSSGMKPGSAASTGTATTGGEASSSSSSGISKAVASAKKGVSNSSSSRPSNSETNSKSTDKLLQKMHLLHQFMDPLNSVKLQDDSAARRKKLLAGENLSREVLLQEQEELRRCSKQENPAGVIIATTVQTLHPKAPAGTLSSKKLPGRPVLLRELRANLDKLVPSCYIILRTIALAGHRTSVMLVVEDSEGNVDRLALYNCFDNCKTLQRLDQLLPIGAGLRIFNPWLCCSQDGWRELRIDQPANVEVLHTEEELYEVGWPRPSSQEASTGSLNLVEELRKLKDRGNAMFGRENWTSCIQTYTRALNRIPASECQPASASAPPLPSELRALNIALLGNRSEAYLQSGQYGLALADAERVLTLEPQQEKAILRRLRALRCLERFEEMQLNPQKQVEEMREVGRLKEEKQGKWNLVALLEESHRIARNEQDRDDIPMTEHDAACVKLGSHATFVHSELVVGAPLPSTVTGRGTVVREHSNEAHKKKTVAIPAHTYVLSEKAIDVWHRRGTSVIEVNLRSDSRAELTHRSSLTSMLLRRCASNPRLARALSLLDAGDSFQEARHDLLAKYPDCIPSLSELLMENTPSDCDTILDTEQASTLVRYHAFTFAEAQKPPSNSDTYESGLAERDIQALANTVTCGFWFVASQFNHSCRPNCFVTVVGDQILIRTMRDIRPGEELTISYLPNHPDSPRLYSERQKALGQKGIKCTCGWCEVFQIHPELEATERDLLKRITELLQELRPLLASQARSSSDDNLKKRLQQISDKCANLVATYRSQVWRVCSDQCRAAHTQPVKGAAECLFIQLIQPLLMQSFIISQLHLDTPPTGSSFSPASKKQRSKWRQHQAILCEQAAKLLAHVDGTGSQLVTLISLEPLVMNSEELDPETSDVFDRRLEELANLYQLFYDAPLPSIGSSSSYHKSKSSATDTSPVTESSESVVEADTAASKTTSSRSFPINGSIPSARSSIADLAGHVQNALQLLIKPLRRFLLAQPSDEAFSSRSKAAKNWDVSECLKKLKEHPDEALAKMAKKLIKLRNQVSHQQLEEFDARVARNGLQLLKDLATRLCAEDEEAKIEQLIAAVPILSKLQQVARDAIDAAAQFATDGQFTEAANEITKVLANPESATLPAPDRAALHLVRAQANFQLELWDIVRDDAEQATVLIPDEADASLLLVETLQRLHLFADAVGECNRILAKHPHHGDLRLLLRSCSANVAGQQHDWNSAKLERELNSENIKLHGERVKADLVGRSPKVDDVRIINGAEFQRESHSEKAELVMRAQFLRSRQQFKEAFNEFNKAAKLGSAEGLYNAGVCYRLGSGCEIDHKKALEYWRSAVKQKPWMRFDVPKKARAALPPAFLNLLPNIGVRESENSIGNAFREGRGVDKNLKEAVKWYLRGAEHGDPSAMNNLGYQLRAGKAILKDASAARRWYKQAADSPEPVSEAMLNYADMCAKGEGGAVDKQEALEYCKKALSMGHPGAAEWIRMLDLSLRSSSSEATSSSTLNPTFSETWFIKARECHHGAGDCKGVIDLEQAAQHYRKAMEMKHLLAPVELALLLEKDLKRPQEAFEVWKVAGKQGHPLAYRHLARCYAFGHGVERNESEAQKYHRRFQASLNNPLAWKRFQRDPSQVATKETLDVELGQNICDIEKAESLSIDGLTIEQRVGRGLLSTMVDGKPSKE